MGTHHHTAAVDLTATACRRSCRYGAGAGRLAAGRLAAAGGTARAAATTSAGLALSLAAIFEQRRYFADWIAVTATAPAIIQRSGDHQRAARVLTHLGITQRKCGSSTRPPCSCGRPPMPSLELSGVTWANLVSLTRL